MFVCAECGTEYSDQGGGICDCSGQLVLCRSVGDDLIGRVMADKYILLQQLGGGGMGTVYRAKQRELDTMVAVKVLRLVLAEKGKALRRFYGEAKNSSKLRHPHNIRVYDFGHTKDGLVYIVMELLDGVPLNKLPRPLPVSRALRIGGQICAALGEAHEIGLIHRDLKPENVMVMEVDGGDFVRVLDYGIAKFEDSQTGLTGDGRLIGTPEYMSPEQFQGQKVDRRSDIYAVGLLLYEMLAGRRTFEADNAFAFAYMHVSQVPEPIGAFTKVPEEVESLALQCLAKNPEERPQSATALRESIVTLLEKLTNQVMLTTGPLKPVSQEAANAAFPAQASSDSAETLHMEQPPRAALGRRAKAVGAVAALLSISAIVAILLMLSGDDPTPPTPANAAAVVSPETEGASTPDETEIGATANALEEAAAVAEETVSNALPEGTGEQLQAGTVEEPAVAAAVEVEETSTEVAGNANGEETADLIESAVEPDETAERSAQDEEAAARRRAERERRRRERDEAATAAAAAEEDDHESATDARQRLLEETDELIPSDSRRELLDTDDLIRRRAEE